jgi:DNA-directed RNA polymerase specialized sigma24 family protein
MADLPSNGQPLDPQDSTMGPASRVERYDALHRVTEALERVPESYRGPLEAVYLQLRSRREVAAEYGISLNNLAQRIHRGLAAWRHELGAESIPL